MIWIVLYAVVAAICLGSGVAAFVGARRDGLGWLYSLAIALAAIAAGVVAGIVFLSPLAS